MANRELRVAVACVALFWALDAVAQTSTESITVTGTRASEQAIKGFVTANTAPTRMAGKITRWKDGICPKTAGLSKKFADFVSQHVRDIAKQVGAPVNSSDSCKTNIDIVFSTKPQALLDNIRDHSPDSLGYQDTSAQVASSAVVTRLIQSWYMTATEGLDSSRQVDSRHSGGMEIVVYDPLSVPPYHTLYVPHASAVSVTGSRLGDGISSALYHVLIVANPDKLVDYEMGALADHIALLALSQQAPQDSCQPLPTILDLLSPGCTPVKTMTDGDLAYLSALYKMVLPTRCSGSATRWRCRWQRTWATTSREKGPLLRHRSPWSCDRGLG